MRLFTLPPKLKSDAPPDLDSSPDITQEEVNPAEQELLDLDALDELDEEPVPQRRFNAPTAAALVKLLPLGLSGFTLLYLFYLGGQIVNLTRDNSRVLVQTVSGRSIVAEPVDDYVRTAATVEQTVKQWADLTFNWVQKLPNGKPDEGTRIGSKTFPTRLIQGSTLMSHDIQRVWYSMFQAREDLLPRNFLGSGATRVFFPKLQTKPKPPLDPRSGKPIEGRYEVEVYGDWVEYSSEHPQGRLVDRPAYALRLRPVTRTEPPLSEDADSLQRIAYELRANGLEIYDIQRIQYVP